MSFCAAWVPERVAAQQRETNLLSAEIERLRDRQA